MLLASFPNTDLCLEIMLISSDLVPKNADPPAQQMQMLLNPEIRELVLCKYNDQTPL